MKRSKRKVHADAEVTEAGLESFPASDPPAFNQGDPHERETAGVSPARGRRTDKKARATRKSPTTAQLRGAIPSQRTPGKTSAADPAAAPFDTDDEAAGRPASAAAVETTLRHEGQPIGTERWAARQRDASSRPRTLLIIGVAVLVLVALWIAIG